MNEITLSEMIKRMDETLSHPSYSYPSKQFCIESALKVPFKDLDELFANADSIREYCKEFIPIGFQF